MPRFRLSCLAFALICGLSLLGQGQAASAQTPWVSFGDEGPPRAIEQIRHDVPLLLANELAYYRLTATVGWVVTDGTSAVAAWHAAHFGGILTGFEGPQGQCVDAVGDVWIADSYESTGYYTGRIVEYQHGAATPKKILTGYGLPSDCAIDPKTGDLAVVNSGEGITVFRSSGSYTNFASQHCQYMGSPGYDKDGNLYVEGWSHSYGGAICELPARQKQLVTRTTNVPGVGGDGIMWDGQYLTVDAPAPRNQDNAVIYRVVARRASGKLVAVGRTFLHDKACGGAKVYQPFIVGKRNTPVNTEEATIIIGSNLACGYRLDYWGYPEAKLLKHLSDAPRNPYGESVSIRE